MIDSRKLDQGNNDYIHDDVVNDNDDYDDLMMVTMMKMMMMTRVQRRMKRLTIEKWVAATTAIKFSNF